MLKQEKQRKSQHIDIVLKEDVESQCHGFFSNVQLMPQCFPEAKLEDISLHQSFLGRMFDLPLLITGMTGGIEKGHNINLHLAHMAQHFNIPMGLGSLKIMMEDPSLKSFFDVKKQYPNVYLIGNLGLHCFNYGICIQDIIRLIDDLKLDAFAFHVNSLQECIQPEGQRDFRYLFDHLAKAIELLPVPVIVKEVGCGMDPVTFEIMAQRARPAAVDVGGRGGTHWGKVEGFRGDSRMAKVFADWGIPTDRSLQLCLALNSNIPLIATGGIRDGLQCAKALALGAQMVGVGLPFFKAAMSPDPEKSLWAEMDFFRSSLRIALFCSGAHNLSQLPGRVRVEGA